MKDIIRGSLKNNLYVGRKTEKGKARDMVSMDGYLSGSLH